MDTEAATAPEPATASQPQAGEESQGTELNAEAWHDQMMADLSAGKLPEGIEDESNGETKPEPEAQETEAQPESEEESEQDESEEQEEAEEESEQEEKPKSSRPRLRATNPVEALAFQIKKENKDWSLSKCEAQARLALGIKDGEEERQSEGEQQPANEIPDLAALDSRIATLRAERKQAILDFDAEKQAELQDEIDRLIDERPKLQQKESLAKQSQASEFDQQFDAAWERAVELYPDAGKENSEFAKAMADIDKELKATNSPLWKEADKAVTIAHMAAKKLLVAPATVKTAPRQSKPVSPLARGSSATRTPTTQDALEKDIDSISTPDDLEKLGARLGFGGLA